MNAKYTKKTFLLPVFLMLVLSFLIIGIWKGLEYFKTEVKIQGGNLKEGIVGSPRFINPVLAQSQADHDLTRLLFTPLLEVTESGDVIYFLAENVTVSNNQKKYTLKLRENIFFQDKTPITTKDLAYTIESIQDPLIKSPLAAKWQGIETAIIDSKTLEFTLSEPFADFIYNLEIGVLPHYVWSDIDPQEFIFNKENTEPVSSGPYSIKNIELNNDGVPTHYTLTRNTNAYESAYLKKIDILFFENEELLVQAIKNQTVDAAFGISPLAVNEFSDSHNIHSGPLPRVFALFFNQEKQTIFKSKNIREAVSHAIDREKITSQVFNSYAVAIQSPLGSQSTSSDYDPTKAQSLIEKEGWRKNASTGIYEKNVGNKSIPLSFTISIPNIKEMDLVAKIVQEQLVNAGIQVQIKSYDQGNLSQNIIRPREYESLLFGYEIEKPSDLYAFWHSSQSTDPGLNVSLFSDRLIDTELEKLQKNPDQSPQVIADKITRQYPAVFLYSPSYTYVLPKELKQTGFNINTSSDRFNKISRWYIHTRKVWSFLTDK